MCMSKMKQRQGFTILELSLAIAVFMIVIGATAQALVSFYVAIDMQHQRQAAVRACTGVLSDMRALRDANPTNFPDAITGVFGDNMEILPNQSIQLDADSVVMPNDGTLRNQVVRITYADADANPLQPQVEVTWDNIRGQPMRVSVATILSDR